MSRRLLFLLVLDFPNTLFVILQMVLEVQVLFGAVWNQLTRRVRKGYILPVAPKKVVVLMTDSRRRTLVFGSLPTEGRFPLGGIFPRRGIFFCLKTNQRRVGVKRQKKLSWWKTALKPSLQNCKNFGTYQCPKFSSAAVYCQIRFQNLQPRYLEFSVTEFPAEFCRCDLK